eukprot:407035_1
MSESIESTLWIPSQAWLIEIDLHCIIEEMKDNVDDGITNWDEIKAKILAPYSLKIHQNPNNNTQIKKNLALKTTVQQVNDGLIWQQIKCEVRKHFNNYCKYKSQPKTRKAVINEAKDDIKQPQNNTPKYDWCNEVKDDENYQKKVVKLSETDISNRNNFNNLLGDTTVQTLRRQSSAGLDLLLSNEIAPTLSDVAIQLSKQMQNQNIHTKQKRKKKYRILSKFKKKTKQLPKDEEKQTTQMTKRKHEGNNIHIVDIPISTFTVETSNPDIEDNNKTLLRQHTEDKTTEEISQFCDDMMDIDELIARCEPFQRVAMVLKLYQELLATHNEEKLCDIIENRGKYEHQQLHDDFMHIKVYHIDGDNDKIRSHDHSEDDKIKENSKKYLHISKKIYEYFVKELKLTCENMGNCRAFSRHYQRIYENNENNWCTEDRAFRTECDKMHIFFFHSTVKYGIKCHQTTAEEETAIDELNYYVEGRVVSKRYINVVSSADVQPQISSKSIKAKLYIGKKEDDLWWNHIQPNDKKQEEEEIYRQLVLKMGVFRWQNLHGFQTGDNRELSHLQPKFKNIKEEALNNEFKKLSKDNWNQTLRKSQIFFNSWA